MGTFAEQNADRMQRQTELFGLYSETMNLLEGDGGLLVAGHPPNPMTIGWGTIGIIWGKPVFQVYVRPTRYTYGLMQHSEEFTVCFFRNKFKKELAVCGTRSGRDTDKMSQCGFHPDKGILVRAPYIREASFHYECRIIHRHPLDPETLDRKIVKRYYPLKDYHMVYYGEIVGTFESEE